MVLLASETSRGANYCSGIAFAGSFRLLLLVVTTLFALSLPASTGSNWTVVRDG